MSIVADGVVHRSLALVAGGRNIEVFTARIAPNLREMNADVFADFVRDDVVGDRHVVILPGERGGMHYTGVIPHDLPAWEYPARLSDLSFSIIKGAGRLGYSSLWLNFSDRPSWRDMPSTFEDYLGFMEGILRYAELVEKEEPASHVSEIVIGCGMETYRLIDKAMDTQDMLKRLRAAFPDRLFR